MSPAVLDAYVRQYIASQPTPEVTFTWQGGEPTLLGVEFFQEVVRLQRKYADGRRVSNAIQTNGTLLDDAWCAFLTDHGFLVGLSVDGPEEFHDANRPDKGGHPSFRKVMRGLECLKKHGTEFNTLTVVSRRQRRAPAGGLPFPPGDRIPFPPVHPAGRAEARRRGAPPGPGPGHPSRTGGRGGNATCDPRERGSPRLRRLHARRVRHVGAQRRGPRVRAALRRHPGRVDGDGAAPVRLRRDVRQRPGPGARRRPVLLRPLRLPRLQARQHPGHPVGGARGPGHPGRLRPGEEGHAPPVLPGVRGALPVQR